MELKIESGVPISAGKGSSEFKKMVKAMKKMNKKQSFFLGIKDMDCKRVQYAVNVCKKLIRTAITMKNREYTVRCVTDMDGKKIGTRVWRVN